MAVGRCEQCGTEEYMPFICKFCKGRYCSAHRLPENHTCQGLEGYRERVRAEGGRFATPEAVLTPKVNRGAALSASFERVFANVEGKMAYVFLGLTAAVFLIQTLTKPPSLSQSTWNAMFVLEREFWLHPWTLLTSIFSHGSFQHFFFNGLVLFFFGPAVERIIGSRRFVGLYLASGVLAGLAQVIIFGYLVGMNVGALGASGALMGLMGTLVILAPKMSVLLMFIIPVPLWAIVAFYAVADIMGMFDPTSSVAHIAHLAGLGLGIAYGIHLRNLGMRVQVQPPQSTMRRYF